MVADTTVGGIAAIGLERAPAIAPGTERDNGTRETTTSTIDRTTERATRRALRIVLRDRRPGNGIRPRVPTTFTRIATETSPGIRMGTGSLEDRMGGRAGGSTVTASSRSIGASSPGSAGPHGHRISIGAGQEGQRAAGVEAPLIRELRFLMVDLRRVGTGARDFAFLRKILGSPMMIRRSFPFVAVALLTVMVAQPVVAQEEEEMAIPFSQKGTVTQRLGYTYFTIVFNRPVARGRELFGGIVNWGRIWNPGADSATTITFTRDITVAGRELAAGSYTMWMIPRESGPWPVIFSNKINIYHTPYPGEEYDALRLSIAPTTASHMETLMWYFSVADRERGELRMHWGETVVAMEIEALGGVER